MTTVSFENAEHAVSPVALPRAGVKRRLSLEDLDPFDWFNAFVDPNSVDHTQLEEDGGLPPRKRRK